MNGNYEDIDKENKVAGTHLNLKFENILNNQLIAEDEAKSLISKSKKGYRRTTTGSKGPVFTSPKSAIRRTGTNVDEKMGVIPEKIYNKAEDVKLDQAALQEYFAYEALNVVNEHFRIKKKKKDEELDIVFDEEIDLAKPLPGKNEIQVYDSKY